ncbi:hypothetical protein ACIRG5_28405 [Lentzea sp. NPDC102401]|uniref:hypothetical protein n=1 Tax=Lentzea sp. NPDC102401 TaxID=3364128 RepID=UPI003800438C
MEELPPPPSSAGKAITDELLRVLRNHPKFQGRRLRPWMYKIREWPGKVVPTNETQIQAAVLTLISRTLWPGSEHAALIKELTPLYKQGWCNDAIIRAMEFNPDGERTRPWHTGTGDGKYNGALTKYLQSRLRIWRQADPDSLATVESHIPPTPIERAVSFEEWAYRMWQVYGDGERDGTNNSMTPEQAKAIFERNHNRRGTPLDRSRLRAQRLRETARNLDELGGTIPSNASNEHELLDPDDELALILDQDVLEAVQTFVAVPQREHRHLTALRAAVVRARRRGTLDRQLASLPEVARLVGTVVDANGSRASLASVRYLIERAR